MPANWSARGKPPAIEFDIHDDLGGSNTYWLMCDHAVTFESLATRRIQSLNVIYYRVIEEALELASGKDLPPRGSLDEIIRDITADPNLAAMLRSMSLYIGDGYCQARRLRTAADDSETSFWKAAQLASKRERGRFFPRDIVDYEFDSDIAFDPAEYTYDTDRAATLTDATDDDLETLFSSCVYGYPMLSGLLLLIVASLSEKDKLANDGRDLTSDPARRQSHKSRGKLNRKRCWKWNPSVNHAAAIIGGDPIRTQLKELGFPRDISQTTLKKAFKERSFVAPLWAAALTVANKFTKDGLPDIASFGEDFHFLLADDESRLRLFGLAKYFSWFASHHESSGAREGEVMIAPEAMVQLPSDIKCIEPALPTLSDDALAGKTSDEGRKPS